VPGVKEENVLKALPPKNEVYETALKVMPQIRRGELGIEAAKLEEKSARAGFFPSISLSASVGTGHMSNNDFESGSQIWNRFNENVGLTLNIPIFSNRKNRTAVNKAKIALNDSYLEWTSLQKELLRNVESAYLDAVSAQAQYLSAREKEKYARESYELTSEQFRVGVKNTVELITAQNEYSAAQQQVLQAKYLTLLSIELLNISGASCERHLLIRTSGFRQAGPHRINR
jgi:outer membrane protein